MFSGRKFRSREELINEAKSRFTHDLTLFFKKAAWKAKAKWRYESNSTAQKYSQGNPGTVWFTQNHVSECFSNFNVHSEINICQLYLGKLKKL